MSKSPGLSTAAAIGACGIVMVACAGASVQAAVVIGTQPVIGDRTARVCAGGLCMNVYKNARGTDASRVVRLTFSGSEVSHYNVSLPEPGGRMVQYEVKALSGATNESNGWVIKRVAGGKYTINVQGCNRGGVLQRSGCTGWKRLTVNF